jgi:hypothetical protein
MELAECWLRQGQPGSAAAALWKIIQICPEKRLALVARDRLRQIGEEAADHHS